MAQSEATVTYVSPTPPTNLLCAEGGSPPTNPADVFTDDGAAGALNTVTAPTTGNVPEATGLIVTVTAPGSRAEAPTQSLSTMGNYVWLGPVAGPPTSPNNEHASNKAPATPPTITGLVPSTQANNGGGSGKLVVNGTGFRPNSVVSVNGIPQNTQYNSATQLTVPNAPKRASAGTLPVIVTTGGTATAATNWTFT